MPTVSAEDLRLAALDRCAILDTPPDVHFDCITRLAAQFFDAPMAAISFVTHDRSWFKSTYGFSQSQLARSASFCSHAIGCREALVIPDATADERFAGLALVAGHPRVRFYAGAPVMAADGFAVGAVAVMDTHPRGPLSESDMCSLRDFSALVSRELNRRSSAGDASSILSAIVQSAEDAITSIDPNNVILTWNPGAERLYGYSAAEVRGRLIDVIIPADRLKEARDMIGKAQQGQPTLRRETVRLHKDGTRRIVSLSMAAVKDADGKPIAVAAITHDITPLKLTEAMGLETEDRLKLAQEAAGLGIWDASVHSGSTICSEQWFRIYGLSASQTTMSYAQWLSIVHPEDRDRAKAYFEGFLRGVGHGAIEFRIVWPDGSVHWVVSKAKMYPNAAGEPVRVVGITLDVTRLRQAEQARRELEEQYTHLFETMSQGVMDLDGEGFILSLNPAAGKLWGLPIEEARGRHRSEFHWRGTREDGAPISADEFPAMVALRTGSELHDVVLRIWNPLTDEPHWVSADAIPRVRAGETKPYQVHLVARDITAQVESEAHLRASEERWRLLIEHGLEVIAVMDATAIVRFISPSVERVFGYPPDLLMGTNAMKYVHPDDWPAVQGALKTMLHSLPRAAVTLHVRFRHRDGGWRTVESVATNCLHVEGLHGIVLNLRDISERVQYEEQLRTSHDQLRRLAARIEAAREEERVRISREVHDEFGQMLSVLKLDLENLAFQHRPREAEARGKFEKRVAAMVRDIDLSANTVRRIAAALRPAVFQDLGLAAALQWQLQEFQARTGIRCRRRGLREDTRLTAEPSLAVFRIFQEILNNVVRHAKATTLEVAVVTDPDWFTLRVSDNGKGFDPKLLPASRSLGMLGIQERARMHGGTVEWSGRRSGGTTVTVRLPRGVARGSVSNVELTPASDL